MTVGTAPSTVTAPAAAVSSTAVSITIADLQKTFGKDVLAVDIEELSIQAGEFVTLVGPSGCGKTTTMRMVVGLEQPSRGRILFGDRLINEVPVQKRNVAMVFQNYALYPHMRVRDNLEYGLKKHRVPRQERQARVARVSEMLHVGHLLERKPRQLSGGEQQRVALGRAIIREPNVLLLDEPLSNLDAKLRTQMRGELVKLQRRVGYTTIYVTHDQLEAMTMSDRIAVMRDGRLQQFDVPSRIYNNPANLFVAGFIGSPPMNFLAGELARLDGRLAFVAPGIKVTLSEEIRAAVAGNEQLPQVVLGIRPEDVGLAAGAGDAATSVSLIEVVGAEKYVNMDTEAGPLIARLPVDEPISEGDRVFCTFRPRKVRLFSAESGVAIC